MLYVYTDLDTILDTRLEVYYNLGIRDIPWYNKRTTIGYKNIPSKLFNLEYSKRTKDNLQDSNVTSIPYLIKDFINTGKSTARSDYFNTIVTIDTYPYRLTKKEVDKLITLVKDITNAYKVEVIFNSIDTLPIKHLARASVVILYDGLSLINRLIPRGKLGLKVSIPDTQLIVPYIAEDNMDMKYLKELVAITKPIIDIQFANVKLFNNMVTFNIDT